MFFQYVWLVLFTTISRETTLKTVCSHYLQTMNHLWFVCDGASKKFILSFREFLNNVFPNQWTGHGRPTEWHARSPDLNNLYFYSGYIWSLLCLLQKLVTALPPFKMYRRAKIKLKWFLTWDMSGHFYTQEASASW